MLDLTLQNLFDCTQFPNDPEVAVNKSELVEAVASAAGLERRQAETAVSAVLDTVMGQVKSGDKVSLFGFGTFQSKDRPARTARNPQTGAAVKVAASKAVKFTPAQAFKTALNTKGGAKKAAGKKAAPAKAAAGAKKAPAKAAASKAPAKKAAAGGAKKTTAAKATKSAKKR